jgi:hypothetical protein
METKFMLIGLEGSGKSTWMKQMKVLFSERGIDCDDQEETKRVLAINIREALREVVSQLVWKNESHLLEDLDLNGLLHYLSSPTEHMPSSIKLSFLSLWGNISHDSFSSLTIYLMDNLGRLTSPTIVPTNDDFIRCHARSESIKEFAFFQGRNEIIVTSIPQNLVESHGFRVGLFDDFMIFFIPIDDEEKMQSSIEMLEYICHVTSSAVFVILSKRDLFSAKNPDNDPESLDKLVKQIRKTIWNDNIYIHVASCVDTDLVDMIMKAIFQTTFHQSLSACGLDGGGSWSGGEGGGGRGGGGGRLQRMPKRLDIHDESGRQMKIHSDDIKASHDIYERGEGGEGGEERKEEMVSHEEEGGSEDNFADQHEGRGMCDDRDVTLLPHLLETELDKISSGSPVRFNIVTIGKEWRKRKRGKNIQNAESVVIGRHDQEKERQKCFDLLDSLSRSGNLPIGDATFHVFLSASHCIDETLLDLITKENVNPIERAEEIGVTICHVLDQFFSSNT